MRDLLPRLSPPLGRIHLDWDQDGPVLRLTGDIDAATVDTYEQRLPDSVISAVDLTGVDFLSSSGVSFLIRKTQPARNRGHLPALRGLSARTKRTLELTRVLGMFRPTAEATGRPASRAATVSRTGGRP